MARNQQPITVDYGATVELTNSDVTEISLQVLRGSVEVVRAASAPTGARGWLFSYSDGHFDLPLSKLSKSDTGARVFAIGIGHPASVVLVDHV